MRVLFNIVGVHGSLMAKQIMDQKLSPATSVFGGSIRHPYLDPSEEKEIRFAWDKEPPRNENQLEIVVTRGLEDGDEQCAYYWYHQPFFLQERMSLMQIIKHLEDEGHLELVSYDHHDAGNRLDVYVNIIEEFSKLIGLGFTGEVPHLAYHESVSDIGNHLKDYHWARYFKYLLENNMVRVGKIVTDEKMKRIKIIEHGSEYQLLNEAALKWMSDGLTKEDFAAKQTWSAVWNYVIRINDALQTSGSYLGLLAEGLVKKEIAIENKPTEAKE